MSRFSDPSDKDVEPTPVGLYVARLKALDEWKSQGGGKYQNDGPQLKWVFELRSVIDANPVKPTRDNTDPKQPEDFVGEEIWGFTGTKMTPNAKARAWAEALMDTTFEEGDAAPEDDDLIGRDCKLYVGRTETGKHKVDKLDAYVAPKRAKRTAPADAEPERELVAAGARRKAQPVPSDDVDDDDEDGDVPF